jgi:integrase
VRLELAALRRAFTLGAEAGRVVRVPCFPTVTVENARSGFVEGAAFDRLLGELPEYLRPLATLACWIGWRKGELLSLEWRQVNLDTGEVRLDPGTTKNGDGRVVFLPPVALEEIRSWRRVTAETERRLGAIVRNVCHHDGQPIRDHYDAWRSACARAGVPGLMLHDLRRSAARNYIRSGIPEAVVMRVLGHRTRSMLDRYNIVSERDLKEAAARVQSVRDGQRAAVATLG